MRNLDKRALCLFLLLAAGVSTPAQATEDLYQVLRTPLYLPSTITEFPEMVNLRQINASSVRLKRLETEMFNPGIITRDIPSPFNSSLRSQASYYQVTGLEPSR